MLYQRSCPADEPTNHLDITSKEVLEDALLHFEGAVMFISHDRYFMSQIANRIFAFENKGVTRHDCDYHDYMEGKGDGLKEKVTARYVEGDRYKITNAKEVIVEEIKSKKNFGGSGVTSGNLFKVSAGVRVCAGVKEYLCVREYCVCVCACESLRMCV
jgi:ABC-type glutathione transport system ATPase component